MVLSSMSHRPASHWPSWQAETLHIISHNFNLPSYTLGDMHQHSTCMHATLGIVPNCCSHTCERFNCAPVYWQSLSSHTSYS